MELEPCCFYRSILKYVSLTLLSLEWKIREIKWSSLWNCAILYSITMAHHKDVVDLTLFTMTSFERHIAKTLATSFVHCSTGQICCNCDFLSIIIFGCSLWTGIWKCSLLSAEFMTSPTCSYVCVINTCPIYFLKVHAIHVWKTLIIILNNSEIKTGKHILCFPIGNIFSAKLPYIFANGPQFAQNILLHVVQNLPWKSTKNMPQNWRKFLVEAAVNVIKANKICWLQVRQTDVYKISRYLVIVATCNGIICQIMNIMRLTLCIMGNRKFLLFQWMEENTLSIRVILWICRVMCSDRRFQLR